MGTKKKDRRLKVQFIKGINDDFMMTKIIRELTIVKKPVISSESKYFPGPEEQNQSEDKLV